MTSLIPQNLNTQDLRMIRRFAPLMPMRDPIIAEREVIDIKKFTKVTTFITTRNIIKELAFYYLYHNKIIDYVKVFTAEQIKDIYVNVSSEYKSINDINYPILVILLGEELYNKQMVTILNILVGNFLRSPISKALIFAYKGTKQEFEDKYKNVKVRGDLNCGQIIQTDKSIA